MNRFVFTIFSAVLSVLIFSQDVTGSTLVSNNRVKRAIDAPFDMRNRYRHVAKICHKYYCITGTIIDIGYIMTTAKWFREFKLINDSEITSNLTVTVADGENVETHRLVEAIFFPLEFKNEDTQDAGDIAVIKLNKDLDLPHNIKYRSLQVPLSNYNYLPIAYANLMYTGFGKPLNTNDKSKIKHNLHFSSAIVVDYKLCPEIREEIKDLKLCVKLIPDPHSWTHSKLCPGDQGASLYDLNYDLLVGVATGKIDNHVCKESTDHDVFTKVLPFREMLREIIYDFKPLKHSWMLSARNNPDYKEQLKNKLYRADPKATPTDYQ